MNEDFNDRLIEESLKQYSRVLPPEGFEERLAARAARRRISRIWWFLVPATAAIGVALLQTPLSPVYAPQRLIASRPMPLANTAVKPVRKAKQVRPRWHVLTGAELARLGDFPELLAKPEEKPITDLAVPELVVKPLDQKEQ